MRGLGGDVFDKEPTCSVGGRAPTSVLHQLFGRCSVGTEARKAGPKHPRVVLNKKYQRLILRNEVVQQRPLVVARNADFHELEQVTDGFVQRSGPVTTSQRPYLETGTVRRAQPFTKLVEDSS